MYVCMVPSQGRKILSGTVVDTVKLKKRTCVKEKGGIGSLQGIKMFLVTPTSKVLPERSNVNYTLRKIFKNCCLFKKRIKENM